MFAVDEDGKVGGRLVAADVDHGASLTFAVDGEGPDGFALSSDGSWSFDASHPTYQRLQPGETRTLEVPYSVTDEHGAGSASTLTLTITGTNDVPLVILPAAPAQAAEGQGASGRLIALDADHGATLSFALSGQAPEGFALLADGSWTFDGSVAAYDQLAEGDTLLLQLPFTVSDENGAASTAQLTLAVTGRNDLPTAISSAAVTTEDVSASGRLLGSDPDAGRTPTYTLVDGAPSGFILNTDGSWNYTPDAALQALNGGESRSFTIGYQVSDQSGPGGQASLTLTVQGANDAPVSAATTVSATENGSATGRLVASDADAGATYAFANVSSVNQPLVLTSNGAWTFNGANSMFQSVAAGEVREFVTQYTVTDQHGARTPRPASRSP